MTITDNDVVGFQELIPFDDATLLNGVFETHRMATPRRIISLVVRLREAEVPSSEVSRLPLQGERTIFSIG